MEIGNRLEETKMIAADREQWKTSIDALQSELCMWNRVSIKFEVGNWLKKNSRLYEQGAVRPINLWGSWGMLSQKILKSGGSEMAFPAL